MSDEKPVADPKGVDAQVVVARPTNSRGCLDQAARLLLFAESETNDRLFEQYTALAEKWMELGELMGGSE